MSYFSDYPLKNNAPGTMNIDNKKEVVCWGTGQALREFLYVDDLAECCIHALEKWDPRSKNAPLDSKGNNLYWLNVGSEFEVSIKELAIKVAQLCEFKGDIIWDDSKPDGTPRKRLNISKIQSLGWSPKIKLDEGITQTIFDYKNNLEISDIADPGLFKN